MSSLPLISHHLFVAAIGHQGGSEPPETSSPEPTGTASAIALEVLDGTEPRPERTARALRAAPSPGSA